MDTFQFVATVAAVITGNAITAGVLIGIWHGNKSVDRITFPMWVALIVAPLIVMATSAFLLT